MASIGDVLDERYRLIDTLGEGRWGRVFLAESVKLGIKWAVKEINLNEDSRVNLLAEPEILKKLSHPRLPRIVDIIKKENCLYIVEDYFEGINLKDLINNRECCSEKNVLRWAKQICEILIYLHNLKPNPIIYRDMKPGNIIIDSNNNAKLVDFGIAREFREDRHSDTTFIGTVGYAAPEQFLPGGLSDERTDIYGLGVTLYHVLTGLHPSKGIYPVREVNPSISSSFEKIISRCVNPRPEHRFQTAKEMMADLISLDENNRGNILRVFSSAKKHLKEKTGLFRESNYKNTKLLGTVTIAIAGAGRRVGCTHTSIVIASYLASRKSRVAVVELNSYQVFDLLRGDMPYNQNGGFSKNGIDFYSTRITSKSIDLGSIIRKGYNYIILDLGQVLTENKQSGFEGEILYSEMQRANMQILVAGSAVWQLPEIAPYLGAEGMERLKVVFSCPDPSLFIELKKQIKREMFKSIFNPNPFYISEEQERFCNTLINSFLSN